MVNAAFEIAEGVGRITIEREEALNSIDLETKEAIIDRLAAYRENDEVRAVLFESEGDRAFSAGGDLKEVEERDFALEPFTESWERLFDAMTRLPKPTVAKVDGYTFGGGFDLILHTDIVVASEDAHIGQPEVNLGIVNHFSPALLPRSVGMKRALDMLLTGDPITGAEAAEAGLVSRAVDAQELDDEVEAVLDSLRSHSPAVLGQIKSAVYEGMEMSPRAAQANADAVAHDPELQPLMREGVESQLEDRPPSWAFDTSE